MPSVAKRSAGLLMWRRIDGGVEVLLGHMGGPWWARKDQHAWSIPKGEYDESENAFDAARREFAEELGTAPPDGPLIDLGEVRQSGGKIVTAWAIEGDLDTEQVVSNTVDMQWPPGSGRIVTFPEIDRTAWFDPGTARTRLVRAQAEFVDRLIDRLEQPDN